MKHSKFLLLLFPALLAMFLSVTSFYFSWKLHSIYVDEVLKYEHVDEKISSMQSISTIDKRLMISTIRNNREYTQIETQLLSDFGIMLSGLSFVIVMLTYRARKQLECPASQKWTEYCQSQRAIFGQEIATTGSYLATKFPE